MPTRNDKAYFLRREQECRAKAANSDGPSVSRTHLDFADNYGRAAARILVRLSDAA
ncbi:MAG: hypothetical protein JOY99_15060 [Sphingomonadaceae bacterium]|nr:hypothetical protein [Sphingomonadaceae bacterium]